MKAAWTGPAPPPATSAKSRTSWPRRVATSVIWSAMYESTVVRIACAAASTTDMPSGSATA